MSRVLVTGANGFVGSRLCRFLSACDYVVRAALRHSCPQDDLAVPEQVAIGDIDHGTQWDAALQDVDCVVHLAARVHVMAEATAAPLEEFRRVNVHGTLNLARQAASAGVRRFLFVSTIGVNGAETFDLPFVVQDVVAPHSPYALSKYEAELGLHALAAETGMEVVIIRPPLVYGPHAPGNFGSLMRWLQRGVPLPLGSIHNQRSLVALENLVDLIVTCLTHPAAVNEIFLVSDGEDVSTTELLRRIGQAMNSPARLVPVPVSIIKLAAAMIGKPEMAQRLCGSLQVDIQRTCETLDWSPPITVEEGLRRAVQGMHG